MEPDKSKIKEPFPPEQTPNPPQIIDPSSHKERKGNNQPVKRKSDRWKNSKSRAVEKKGKRQN